MKRLICYLVICLISLNGSASNLNSQTHDLRFEHISTEHELSQNTIHSIIQDQKGFIWFATEDGLNKFDGFKFVTYRSDPQNSKTISDNFVWCIYEDSKGNIWIGTNDKGLNKFDRFTETFTRYQYSIKDPFTLSNNSVRKIIEDRNGNIWIGTEGGGINKFNPATGKFRRYPFDSNDKNGLSDNSVRALFEDDESKIWIGTDGGGLNVFNPETGTFKVFTGKNENSTLLANESVWAFIIDAEKNIWIGTANNGLYKFNGEVFKLYQNDLNDQSSIINNAITDLFIDDNEQLWICTEGGLCKYDKESDSFDRYLHDPYNRASLSNNLVRTIYQDRTGIYWIGTVGGGINKIIKEYKKIELYVHDPSDPKSLSSNMIRSILEDKEGVLWIGTLGGGINRLDDDGFTNFKHSNDDTASISDDGITSIYEDNKGNLWIGTWGGGLNKLDVKNKFKSPKDAKFKKYFHQKDNPNSLVNDIVQAISEDRYGNLWIGTQEGLDYFDITNNRFVHFTHDKFEGNSLSDNRIQSSCILEDSRGNLWIGTWNGLNFAELPKRYTSNTIENIKFKRFVFEQNKLNGLRDSRIISLYEDSDQNIWIGTHGGGLNKITYNNNKDFEIEVITKNDGLASNVIYGIEGDKNGNLWLSSNNGLSKFNYTERKIRNYRESDGFQSNQFFYGASTQGKDGKIYFGGVNGVNAFYPNQLKDNPNIPPVYITDFQLFNAPVEIGTSGSPLKVSILETKKIELPYREYVLSFGFVALDFTNPEQNKYKYMLEGYDHNWINTDHQRQVTYGNLGNGNYVFKVLGSNNDGLWNDVGAQVTLIIHPPFWKTWWFILLSFITIVGIIIYIVATQVKQLLAVERLRTKLAADLHDNIGSSLTEISILSEVITTRLKDADKDIIKGLGHISENSRQLIDKMSDIVWLVNPKRDSLYDLILRLEDNYSELLSQTNISFKSENLRSLERVSLSMEHRQHLYLIFKEAINNSITHGECSEIFFNANVRGKTLSMVLTDNGKGFDVESLSRGNGLNNMKDRAKKIGGTIEITSSAEKGTTIHFVGIM